MKERVEQGFILSISSILSFWRLELVIGSYEFACTYPNGVYLPQFVKTYLIRETYLFFASARLKVSHVPRKT